MNFVPAAVLVPEPTTWIIFGTALLIVIALRKYSFRNA